MARIAIPEIKQKVEQSDFQRFLPIITGGVGAVIGGIAGGPGGAVAGAGAGAGIGNTLGGIFQAEQSQKNTPQGVVQNDSSISRRLAANREDRLATLRQAEAAIRTMPKEIREEYGPTIVKATVYEEQQRAMGRSA